MQLNQRQTDVLGWIADGCPERAWPNWTHRSTAKALQSRGLVRVRGRGAAWSAVVTDRGRRVLDGEEDQPPPRAARKRTELAGQRTGGSEPQTGAEPPTQDARVDPAGLVAELDGADGHVVRVRDPDQPTRAGYRRALAAITLDQVPDGLRITYTGRDHGDLVIRYATASESPAAGPPVPVPSDLDAGRPLLAWLVAHPGVLEVSPGSCERALRIVQGIQDTLTALGHTVSVPRPTNHDDRDRRPGRSARRAPAAGPPGTAATFEVTVGEQVITVSLFEEKTKVRQVPAEAAANLKYDWQRATPVETWEFNGRLALRIHDHATKQGWADRQRWTLESRLSRFVTAVLDIADSRAETERRATEARLERRREWEAAIPQARAAYLNDLNRGRLTTQVEAFTKAVQLRSYADAVTVRAEVLAGAEREAALEWVAWIRGEADRQDPTRQPGALQFIEPAEIRPWDLDRFMPRGWSVTGPPDESPEPHRSPQR